VMRDHSIPPGNDLLDRAIDAVLSDVIPGDVSSQQVAQLATVVRQAAAKPYPATFLERIRSMKPSTKLAVSATVLLAFVAALLWFLPSVGSAVAFAEVAEAFNSVHSATWKMTWSSVEGPKGKAFVPGAVGMFLAPCHERLGAAEHGGSACITDSQQEKMLNLDPRRKIATVSSLASLPPNDPSGRIFQNLRSLMAEARRGKAGKVERLGDEMIDGHTAVGFRIRLGDADAKIWADPKTLLPVRVECDRLMMTDFRINPELDKSLFSLDVPAGYTVRTMRVDPSKTLWVGLTGALKLAAEHNGGMFPSALRGEQGIDGIMQRAVDTFKKEHGEASPEALKLSQDVRRKLDEALAVLNALPPDAWHYAGKNVKPGTPDRPILWAKNRSGTGYHAIYADLSVKAVSVKEASEFPRPTDGSKP
jgi:hypothetical protein